MPAQMQMECTNRGRLTSSLESMLLVSNKYLEISKIFISDWEKTSSLHQQKLTAVGTSKVRLTYAIQI